MPDRVAGRSWCSGEGAAGGAEGVCGPGAGGGVEAVWEFEGAYGGVADCAVEWDDGEEGVKVRDGME